MASVPKEGVTIKERGFADTFFETRGNKPYSMKVAGYPADDKQRAIRHADVILARPRVKAYLRGLWEASESPIIMGLRERKEKLSLIARGMVGTTFDEDGHIDWEAVRNMPAVKEITIEEDVDKDDGDIINRKIKVKLLDPVTAIHELSWMENTLNRGSGSIVANTVINNYYTDESIPGKVSRIGDRTKKVIEATGKLLTGGDGDEIPVQDLEDNDSG